jgi:hypothetical protein
MKKKDIGDNKGGNNWGIQKGITKSKRCECKNDSCREILKNFCNSL